MFTNVLPPFMVHSVVLSTVDNSLLLTIANLNYLVRILQYFETLPQSASSIALPHNLPDADESLKLQQKEMRTRELK